MGEVEKQVLFSLIYFFVIVLIAGFLRSIWGKIKKRTSSHFPSSSIIPFLEETRSPIYYLIVVGGFYFSLQRLLVYSQVKKMLGVKFICGLFYSAVVLLISYLVYVLSKVSINWYLEKIAPRTRTHLDEEFLPLMNRLLKVIILFIAVTIILDHFKVNIAGFLATAGVASLAVAFAAQETLANFISGFTIMIDKPFRVGDRIKLPSGEIGDVTDIGLRSTKILSFDHNIIVIPNKEITNAQLVNYSYPTPRFKIRAKLGVAYGSDMEKVKKVLMDILRKDKNVLEKPSPEVFFTDFGDSSLNLLIVYWISDYRNRFRISDEINMEIDKKFREKNISIPFPQHDVHIIPPEENE